MNEFQKLHLEKAEELGREIYKNLPAEDKLKEFEKLWYEAEKLKASYLRDLQPIGVRKKSNKKYETVCCMQELELSLR